jgi:hypothetical protein
MVICKLGSKIIYSGSRKFIFWAAAFVNWAAKLDSRFYFFRTAKFINGQQLLKS